MDEIRTAFTDQQYANPYPPGIERHYWHQARNRILMRKLKPVLSSNDKVLDIGCGPGIVVDFLRRLGVDCTGVDLGSPVPATSEVAPFLSLGKSAFDLDPAVKRSYTVLLLMDMLEHLPNPEEFLRYCELGFPNARHMLVTLPARMEIWTSYDECYGHYRRYTLEALSDLASKTELDLVSSGYFFHLLYAAARIVTTVNKKRSHRVVAPKSGLLHAALGRLFSLEESVVPGAARGASLYALFRRRGT